MAARFALGSLCLHAVLLSLGLMRLQRGGAEQPVQRGPDTEIEVLPDEVAKRADGRARRKRACASGCEPPARSGTALRDAVRQNTTADAGAYDNPSRRGRSAGRCRRRAANGSVRCGPPT